MLPNQPPSQPQGQPPQAAPKLPPMPQRPQTVTIDQVMKLMRDDRMRSFRIDVETDSTIQADENEHKQRINELLTGIATYFEKVMPVAQSTPELAPFLGEALLTAVRAHRAGRQLEGALEDAIDKIEEKAMAGGAAPPSPEMVKAQFDAALAEKKLIADAKSEQMKIQSDERLKTAELASKQELKSVELNHKQELALADKGMAAQKQRDDTELQRAKIAGELDLKHEFETRRFEHEKTLGREKFDAEMGLNRDRFDAEQSAKQEAAMLDRERAAAAASPAPAPP